MPALVVAMAGNPASSTIRALATSQTLGSSSTSRAECRARNASAFFFCSRFGIQRNWMCSAVPVLHLFDEASHAYDGAPYLTTADFLRIIVSCDLHDVEAAIEGFEHCFGFDACANAAGGAMFHVDRGSHGDLVAFAVWLQGVEGGGFHQADHV